MIHKLLFPNNTQNCLTVFCWNAVFIKISITTTSRLFMAITVPETIELSRKFALSEVSSSSTDSSSELLKPMILYSERAPIKAVDNEITEKSIV